MQGDELYRFLSKQSYGARLDLIQDAARRQDVDSLRSIYETDVLDISQALNWCSESGVQGKHFAAYDLCAVTMLFASLQYQRRCMAGVADPMDGRPIESSFSYEYWKAEKISPPMREVMKEVVDTFIGEWWNHFRGLPESTVGKSHALRCATDTLGVALCAAAAMNDVDLMRTVIAGLDRIVPDSGLRASQDSEPIPVLKRKGLGTLFASEYLFDAKKVRVSLLVSPAYLAVRFGSLDALHLLLENGCDLSSQPAVFLGNSESGAHANYAFSITSDHRRQTLLTTLHAQEYVGIPSVMRVVLDHVLTKAKSNPIASNHLHDYSFDLISASSPALEVIRAAADLGVYDVDSKGSLIHACMHGCHILFDHLSERIDWATLEDYERPVDWMFEESKQWSRRPQEMAAFALACMKEAVAKGRADMLLDSARDIIGGKRIDSPLTNSALRGLNECVLFCLENRTGSNFAGMDVRTAIEAATSNGHDRTALLMRSFLARHEALNGVEDILFDQISPVAPLARP